MNRHATTVAAAPDRVYHAMLDASLRDMPITRALFRLRGIPFRRDMTVRGFFSTPPFGVLEEDAPREVVFGVTRRGALRAVGNFRVEARGAGALLSTETWVETFGARARWLFRLYWLFIGPFSGLIRREFLRVARRQVEGT